MSTPTMTGDKTTGTITDQLMDLKNALDLKLLSPELYEQAVQLVVRSGGNPQPSQDGVTQMSRYFLHNEEESIHPWMKNERRTESEWKRSDKCFLEPNIRETQKKSFINRAKAGRIAEFEAFLFEYILFTEDTQLACHRLTELLLSQRGDPRVEIHNWGIAKQMPEGLRRAYGPAIPQLKLPLFPRGDLDELNDMLLVTRPEQLKTEVASRLYATPEGDPLFGGAYQAPVTGNDGTLVGTVELSDVENAFNGLAQQASATTEYMSAIQSRIAQMEREIHLMKRSFRAPQAQQPQQHLQPASFSNYYNRHRGQYR